MLLALIMTLSMMPLDIVAAETTHGEDASPEVSTSIRISEDLITNEVRSADGTVVVSSSEEILPEGGYVEFKELEPVNTDDGEAAGAQKTNNGKKDAAPGQQKKQDKGGKGNNGNAYGRYKNKNKKEVGRYDISVKNKNKKNWQPGRNETVDVRVNLSKPIPVTPGSTLTLIHDPEGVNEVVQTAEFTRTPDGTQLTGFTFKADGFSVYVVTEETALNRLHVVFNKDTEKIGDAYVKEGDNLAQVLVDPGVGDLDEGVIFRGWTTDPDYDANTQGLSISDIRTAVEGMLPPAQDDETVTYYAMLFKQYKIDYLDPSGNASLGTESFFVRADDNTPQTYTINTGYNPVDDMHKFDGWIVTEDTAGNIDSATFNGEPAEEPYQKQTELVIHGNVTFMADTSEGHWLIFNENGYGGTYNAPQFVNSGEVTVQPDLAKPENMRRNGYTFDGWFKDKDCTIPFSFGGELTEKTTIYSHLLDPEPDPGRLRCRKRHYHDRNSWREHSIPIS